LHGNDTLQQSLAAKGYSLDDVTDVILTHLHFDHCGGAIVRDGEKLLPAFKNATYWSNEAHWINATQPNAREKASFLKENILPIQESGQLKFIEAKDNAVFNNNIHIKLVNGHTEGMMLPLINYNGNKILYCADLYPSPHHVSLPWIMAYDMQPLVTLNEKEKIMKEACVNNYTLFFEHDKDAECAKLVQTEKGIKVGEVFPLAMCNF
jgi:glyoxylase-like metal-dependent hydrolase (beta-lactamase superfamily II)